MNALPLPGNLQPPVVQVLPARPLPIDGSYARKEALRAIGFAILSIAMTALVAGYGIYGATQILDAERLFERGSDGEVMDVQGTVTENSKLGVTFLYEYKLEIPFQDPDGNDHIAKIEFDRFWSKVPDEAIPQLRFDPANPEIATLNWAFDGGFNTWGWPIFMVSVGIFMLAGGIAFTAAWRRQSVGMRLGAQGGLELPLECVSVTAVQKSYQVVYLAPDPKTGQPRRQKIGMRHPPLTVRINGVPHVVTLVSIAGERVHTYVVDQLLSGFALPPDVKAAVQQLAERS